MKATLDEAGRIEIPESLQKLLGLKPGDCVELVEQRGELVITPPQPVTGLQWEGNVLVHRGIGETCIDEQIRGLRAERRERLTEGLPR